MNSREVKRQLREELLNEPGVTGIASEPGEVIVTADDEREAISIRQRVPNEINNVRIVVKVLARSAFLGDKKKARTARYRPMVGGVSTGEISITAGTLGGFVNLDGKPVMISCYHVLTPVLFGGEAKRGDPIIQPAHYDGGTQKDVVATLEKWVPYAMEGWNRVDVAIARPLIPHTPGILGDGGQWRLTGIATPGKGMRVKKSGRTTGVTHGTITYTSHDTVLDIPELHRSILFEDQLIVEDARGNDHPFVLPGDSGSLLLTEDDKIVGLIFAGSAKPPYHAMANNFSDVIGALRG